MPMTETELKQRAERRKLLRTIESKCSAAADVLAKRADVLDRAADRNAAQGKDRGERSKRARAANLRLVAVMLADADFRDTGVIDLVEAWDKPPRTTTAERVAVRRAAPAGSSPQRQRVSVGRNWNPEHDAGLTY